MPNAALITSRKYLEAEPVAAEAVIKSIIEGIHFYKTEKVKTPAILKKYMKIENAEDLQESYSFYVKLLNEKPYPRQKAFKPFSTGRSERTHVKRRQASSSTPRSSRSWTSRDLSTACIGNSLQGQVSR
jgi:ABC-type nitrate/sulfonate/bicarbonate transport system substrate-binding protein